MTLKKDLLFKAVEFVAHRKQILVPCWSTLDWDNQYVDLHS